MASHLLSQLHHKPHCKKHLASSFHHSKLCKHITHSQHLLRKTVSTKPSKKLQHSRSLHNMCVANDIAFRLTIQCPLLWLKRFFEARPPADGTNPNLAGNFTPQLFLYLSRQIFVVQNRKLEVGSVLHGQQELCKMGVPVKGLWASNGECFVPQFHETKKYKTSLPVTMASFKLRNQNYFCCDSLSLWKCRVRGMWESIMLNGIYEV